MKYSWLVSSAVITLLATWSIVVDAATSARAQASLPAGLLAFGQETADRLNDAGDMSSLLVPHDVTCPQYEADGSAIQLCAGVAAGTVVPGCLNGRFGSGAGYGDCAVVSAYLSGIRASEFEGRELKLFTASPDGRTVGGLSCPECVALIYSTPADAASTATKAPNVLELQLAAVNGEWTIYAFAVGSASGEGASSLVHGGTFDGRTFIAASPPEAPNVGTGQSTNENTAPLLTLAGLLVAAGVAGLAVSVRRRNGSAVPGAKLRDATH